LTLNERSFKKEWMRKKDASKKQAIFRATQHLINEEGFARTSMAKIARRAGVSPATIYTYFANKDDVLNELYVELKRRMFKKIMTGLDESMNSEQWFRRLWHNTYEYYLANAEDFVFCEHFKHTPHVHEVSQERVANFVEPIKIFFERGIRAGEIRPLPGEVVQAFVFYPIVKLARDELTGVTKMTPELRQKSEDIAWQILAV